MDERGRKFSVTLGLMNGMALMQLSIRSRASSQSRHVVKSKRAFMHAPFDNRSFHRRSQNARRVVHAFWVIEWPRTPTKVSKNDDACIMTSGYAMRRTHLAISASGLSRKRIRARARARPALNRRTFVSMISPRAHGKRLHQFAVFPSFSFS